VLIIAGITRTGHIIDMALMRFMLFYAGVFALIGLTAAVGVGPGPLRSWVTVP
jgi:hypothetical protein